ncbi:MAG: TlpA family protein disulfide reductase, partial [Aestuariibacter sp.]|nr:TlpA family protein disulfide reductase [Aestuariibacter sp.]
WCKPCVDEIPSLSRLNRLYNANDFAILTVNTGESSQRVKKFIEPFDINFAILLDENGKAVRDWRVYAFPSNFLIDKNGVIRYGYRGALEWDSKEVLEIIETLL